MIPTSTFKNAAEQIAEALEDRAFDILREKSRPFMRLMSYYKCAMLEIETKFQVLNEEYSLTYNRNPISTIKTRLTEGESNLMWF